MPIGGVATGGFLVARGYGSELLDLREEVLDQMPPFVSMSVKFSLDLAVRFRWDDCARTPRIQLREKPIGVEGLVRKKGIEGHVLDQWRDAFQVVGLTWQENEIEQIPERIDQRHDLGGQSAARAPDGLSLSPPFAPLAF